MKTDLNKYKSKSGFKTPPNYMDDFEANLFEKMNLTASKTVSKSSGFQVPEGYFNNLEHQLSAKLESGERKGKLVSLFSKRQVYYAASIAAIFIVLFSVMPLKSPEANSLNNLNATALETYIQEEDLDLNYNDISNLIFEEGLIIESLDSYSYSDQAVLEYLNENIENSEFIIE